MGAAPLGGPAFGFNQAGQCLRNWLRKFRVRSLLGALKKVSGSASSTIFPPSMKTTRSATARAKPISWVTQTMVIPSFASATMVSRTSFTLRGQNCMLVHTYDESSDEIAGQIVCGRREEAAFADGVHRIPQKLQRNQYERDTH